MDDRRCDPTIYDVTRAGTTRVAGQLIALARATTDPEEAEMLWARERQVIADTERSTPPAERPIPNR